LFPQLADISLACDYRIVSEDTAFQNTFLKLGYIPKGGEAYFLEKRLGHCKACEILLSEKDISAQEAMELGIVNKVVPFEELENEAFRTAKYFAQKPATSLTGIKKLLNYSMKDLPDYLEFETQELMNVLGPFS
jgi:enoyl-CoA hydratase/carnithine racemase